MIKFIKDGENYEIRIVNGDEYEVAGELVKDEDGVWCFSYGSYHVLRFHGRGERHLLQNVIGYIVRANISVRTECVL